MLRTAYRQGGGGLHLVQRKEWKALLPPLTPPRVELCLVHERLLWKCRRLRTPALRHQVRAGALEKDGCCRYEIPWCVARLWAIRESGSSRLRG